MGIYVQDVATITLIQSIYPSLNAVKEIEIWPCKPGSSESRCH